MKLLLVKFLLYLYPTVVFTTGNNHPFHVSTSDISFNVKEQKLEVICSIFTDDFENALSRENSTKADFNNKAKHKTMELLVKKYLAENLQIKSNAKIVPLNFLGFEQDKEAIVIYLESAKIPAIKRIEIENSILLDHFPDEMNIVHITVNGQRKSHRLDYPDHLITEAF